MAVTFEDIIIYGAIFSVIAIIVKVSSFMLTTTITLAADVTVALTGFPIGLVWPLLALVMMLIVVAYMHIFCDYPTLGEQLEQKGWI